MSRLTTKFTSSKCEFIHTRTTWCEQVFFFFLFMYLIHLTGCVHGCTLEAFFSHMCYGCVMDLFYV